MLKQTIIFLALALVYGSFLTRTYYWDGVLFSLYIEKVASGEFPTSVLFHPNHLLYTVVGYLCFIVTKLLGIHIRAITVLQTVNIVASLASAGIIFTFIRTRFKDTSLAMFATVLFSCGATWWKFSTDADSYIISVFLLLASITALVRNPGRLFLPGVCLVSAMLFHELAIFGYVPALLAIWLQVERSRERIRRIILFASTTAFVVTVAYLLAFQLAGHPEEQSFVGWIASRSRESQVTHRAAQLVIKYPLSYLKLFGGGKLSLVRDYISMTVIIGLGIAVGCAALAIRIALRRRQAFPPGTIMDGRMRIVFFGWLLPYFLFLAWFEPGNAFYKLFVWPPIVLLIVTLVAEKPALQRRVIAWIWASVALAGWNFAAFIYPHSISSADPVLELAERINRELPVNSTIYYRAFSPDDWYLAYFAPGRKWRQMNGRVIAVKDNKEGPVCFETTALPYIKSELDPKLRWDLISNRHNVRLECLQSGPH